MRKKTTYTLLIAFSFVLCCNFTAAQNFWGNSESGNRAIAKNDAVISKFRKLTLDIEGMRAYLQSANLRSATSAANGKILEMPDPTGGFIQLQVFEDPIMEPGLAAKFPEIKTYIGYGPNNIVARLDLTEKGFHGMMLAPGLGDIFIDPAGESENYLCYFKRDFQKNNPSDFSCGFKSTTTSTSSMADNSNKSNSNEILKSSADNNLRKYRLAVSANYEYSSFHGGTQSSVMSAITTTMNRVNAIYGRDLAIKLILIADNDKLIYLNSNDPFTNNSAEELIDENQKVLDDVIGNSSYDIGHVFTTGGGGLAYFGVCNPNLKGKAVTGSGSPVGDPFDIDYVAHEMGHQFHANHTFNNYCDKNRVNETAYEVGSGITIMGYAGICSPNVGNKSDAMFHAISLQEINNFVTSNNGNCAQKETLTNSIPTANAGSDYTIPISTPFTLKGTATDANSSDQLTYSWEQMDKEIATMAPLATSTKGPAFRTFLPQSSPERTFPRIEDIVSNNTPTWEVLASVSRSYNFRLVVRDNAPGGGLFATDDMKLNVSDQAGPFKVTAPNTNESVTGNTNYTVKWDVAGTNNSPVNCQKVNIKLSTDGGLTYPTTLASSVNNNGSQSVTIPNTPSSEARIRVEAADNVFFDISNANFSITTGGSGDVKVTGVSLDKTDLELDLGQSYDLSETVSPSNATNKTVTWSSQNPNIATVNNNGVISTVAAGTTTITVTTDDGGFTASCNLSVKQGQDDGGKLVAGVAADGHLDQTDGSDMWYIDVPANTKSMRVVLECGNSDYDTYGKFNAEPGTTSDSYDWRGYTNGGEDNTINNPKEGRHYIMADWYSGSGAYTLKVTFESRPADDGGQLTLGVTANGNLDATDGSDLWYVDVPAGTGSMRVVLECGNSDFDTYGKFNAEPGTSSGSYDWRGYTDGGEDNTINDPEAGRHYILANYYSGSSSTYSLTVSLSANRGNETVVGEKVETSASKETNTSKIDIYPNPTKDHITVNAGDLSITKLALFDITGKQLITVENAGQMHNINLGNINNGVYMLRIETKDDTFVKRIIKE